MFRLFKGLRSQKTRLQSLEELAQTLLHEDSFAQNTAHTVRKKQKKRSVWKRIVLFSLSVILIPLILILASLAYITSPFAETHLRDIVTKQINLAGKEYGLHVHIGGIGGFWDGRIQIRDMRVNDGFGPWLYVDEGTLYPQWQSLVRAIAAIWQYTANDAISKNLISTHDPLAQMPNVHENSFHSDTQGNVQLSQNATQDTKDKKKTPEELIDNLLDAETLLKDKVVIGLKIGTLLGVRMPRFPRYTSQEPVADSPEKEPERITFLPPWLAIDIGELELVRFQLGQTGRDLRISARLHGQIAAEQLRLRSTMLAATAISSQWVLPSVHDLPKDVKLSLRRLRKHLEDSTEGVKRTELFDKKNLLTFLSLDFDAGNIDFRWHLRDALLTSHFVPGIKSIWTRSRFLGHISAWPPSKENPVQGKLINRFGMRLVEDNQKIKASTAGAQFLWDGANFVLRDVTIHSPVRKPVFTLSGSAGMAPKAGLGLLFRLSIDDIGTLARMTGINTDEQPVKGPLTIDASMGRSGEYTLWWTKPLPPIQQERDFPNFTIANNDYSILARHIHLATETIFSTLRQIIHTTTPEQQRIHGPQKPALVSKIPQKSTHDSPFAIRIKAESPHITLPQGPINTMFFSIHASSVDAANAPAGTAFKRKKAPATETDEVEKSTINPKPAPTDVSNQDFTVDGLPRGLVGTAFLRFGDIFDMGVGTFKTKWFLGGYHDEADVWQLELEDFHLAMPGLTTESRIGFAYALPRLKRRWPWVDGHIKLHMDHGRWISLFTHIPTQANGVNIHADFKSFLNSLGQPSQYLHATLGSGRVDSRNFMVRGINGTLESNHVHALADSVGLSIGALRDALERKMEYTPPETFSLFDSRVTLDAGRSGNFRWSDGTAQVQVHGEKAQFSVKMLGDFSGLLEGSFHFRRRVLSLKDMQIFSQ